MIFLYILCNILFAVGTILAIKYKVENGGRRENSAKKQKKPISATAGVFGVILMFLSGSTAVLWVAMGVDDRFFPVICIGKWRVVNLYKYIYEVLTIYDTVLKIKDGQIAILGIIFCIFVGTITIFTIVWHWQETKKS